MANDIALSTFSGQKPRVPFRWNNLQYDNVKPESPTGLWFFSETSGTKVVDSSRWNFHGALSGSSLDSMHVFGSWGPCLKFNGTDNYVEVGNGAQLQQVNDYSILARIRPDVMVNSSSYSIIGHGYQGWYFRVGGAQKLEILKSQTSVILSGNAVMTAGKWYDVAMTVSPDSGGVLTFALYINDGSGFKLDNSALGSISTSGIGQTVKIGCETNNLGVKSEFFNGIIDHVIFIRKQLSAAQITQHFADPYQLVKSTSRLPKAFFLYSTQATSVSRRQFGPRVGKRQPPD